MTLGLSKVPENPDMGTWKPTELDPRLLSISALTSFVANDSASRVVMDSGHISSKLSLENPEVKQSVFSGAETEFGKLIDDVKTAEDCIVLSKVMKYPHLGDLNPETALFTYSFREDRHGTTEIWLDLIIVPTTVSKHTHFGHRLHRTEELEEARDGTKLPKGTLLGRADSYSEDGSWMHGVNMNIAMTSDEGAAEDGFRVAESALEKLAYTSVATHVFNLTKKDLLVNAYGDDERFQVFPDIGEGLRPDGILYALRELNPNFLVSSINNRAIKEVDYTFDDACYPDEKSSVVVDVTVYRGNRGRPWHGDVMVEQLEHYYRLNMGYADNLRKAYHRAVSRLKRDYGQDIKIQKTGRLLRFITDKIIHYETQTYPRPTTYRRKDISEYRVEIKVLARIVPNKGYKLTGIHGDKGVICSVIPDEDMPVDEWGVRAEVVADGLTATINRKNLGRLYEAYFGALARDNQTRIRERLRAKYGDQYKYMMQQEDADEIIQYLRTMFTYINLDTVAFYDSLAEPEDRMAHARDIVEDWIYIYYPPNNGFRASKVIKSLEKTPYKPNHGKVTFRDGLGRMVTSKDNVRIGRVYIIHLDRTGRDYSAVSSAKVNSYLLPIKGGEFDKYSYPHSQTPATPFSETEGRMSEGYATGEFTAEMFDLTHNLTSHELVTRNFLENEKLFDMEFNIDRNIVPYGNTRPIGFAKHILGASGLVFKYLDGVSIKEGKNV